MRRRPVSDADAEVVVEAALRQFFNAHRNERWMPVRILQSTCPRIRPRQLRDALARLTEAARIEPAQRRPGNPYTHAYRQIAPLVPIPASPTHASVPDQNHR